MALCNIYTNGKYKTKTKELFKLSIVTILF